MSMTLEHFLDRQYHWWTGRLVYKPLTGKWYVVTRRI